MLKSGALRGKHTETEAFALINIRPRFKICRRCKKSASDANWREDQNMDTVEQGMILLMKSAITGESCRLPEQFDLEKAYALMAKHTVVPLGYEGAVRCGIDKSSPVMQKMFMVYCT